MGSYEALDIEVRTPDVRAVLRAVFDIAVRRQFDRPTLAAFLGVDVATLVTWHAWAVDGLDVRIAAPTLTSHHYVRVGHLVANDLGIPGWPRGNDVPAAADQPPGL